MSLEVKIENRTAKVGVIGLGYVGLPLAVEYAAAGYKVLGIDVSGEKIAKLNRGENYIEDVDSSKLKELVKAGKISGATTYKNIGDCDVIYICVPTPFTENKDPDVSYIIDSAKGIASGLRRGQLIILKSTTYPETTEKIVQPILEETGLKVGKDFYLAFSPERIDPGNKKFTTATTPIVVGGVTKKCTKLAAAISRKVIIEVKELSSPKAAEMTKLLENIFRSVNIALVNELAQLCDRMEGVNIWEVVEAAATKPFGFMPFYPGPGIGGHCILVDPYYLAWKAKEYDFHTSFIELAAQTNENMPYYVLDLIIRSLSLHGVAITTSKILILGVAFKKNVDDTRNSPAIKVMELLYNRGGRHLMYNDPYVPALTVNGKLYHSKKLDPKLLKSVDCVVITTNHDAYDYEMIVKHAKLVVDTRNATKDVKIDRRKIIRLGCGTNAIPAELRTPHE
ncbi:MAG: nucleotide sugar dehydrogenase [candidate division KSB1 bacterium]|nr:nucleotide sugar dehydrogenase [candidate division KSB1 bacterium]MDZ7301022.1 nucleotide sugar dehydrogenase [candidate division KSB1 bacterium]MDZ7310300.1 nucleotide sugar dehydrogenase [candidate division KSB1 bacterium]